jgi:hypothetical protein
VLFLVSYVLVVNWTLLPIVFAALVDSFVAASRRGVAEARARRAREARRGLVIQHTLDPLLRFLTVHYVDDADLSGRLGRLFKVPCALTQMCITYGNPAARLKPARSRPPQGAKPWPWWGGLQLC